MHPTVDANAAPFNRDVLANQGYLYTANASLSSRLANQRLTAAALELADLGRQQVIDIGCGDGTYTFELYDAARPASLTAVDAAHEAIFLAEQQRAGRPITFGVASCYGLPYPSDSFDLAHVRGVLHHLDRPVEALAEALRVAKTVLVIEPNGYNPVLKLIERVSAYHIEHGEKSYAPHDLDRWIGQVGGRVVARRWVGLVPFFCPDWPARVLKAVEPLVERLPLARRAACGVYAFVAERSSSPS
ncbi:MAG TPA: class I SAM-dependent methyltransferase [Herpetosiphonaceae bacterium]